MQTTAKAVGIGAVVFANLMSQRDKDVDFDWDDILSTSGDSGVYVQYGHARCSSILGKGGITDIGTEADFSLLTQPQEKSLALALSQLGDVVAKAADHNDPHLLSRYLLEVVSGFSTWYTQGNQDKSLRVLCDDEATKRARLTLVAITRAVLKEGLGILGVGAPDSM